MDADKLDTMACKRAFGAALAAILLGGAGAVFAQGMNDASLRPEGAAQARLSLQSASGWRPLQVVEAGSSEASAYARLRKVPVTLPDDSQAQLAVGENGEPQALLFPESNAIASARERALEAGAALNGDRSVTLPLSTAAGSRIDVVIRPDGSAMVPGMQNVQESTRR